MPHGGCGKPMECFFCGGISLEAEPGGRDKLRTKFWEKGGEVGLAETKSYRAALFDRCGDDKNCGFQPLDGEIRICDAILAEMLEIRKAIFAARAAAMDMRPPANGDAPVGHDREDVPPTDDGGGFPQSIALLLPVYPAPPLVSPGAVVSGEAEDSPSSISVDDVVGSTTPTIGDGERPPDASDSTVASSPTLDGGGNSSPVPSVPAKPETPQVGKFAHYEQVRVTRK